MAVKEINILGKINQYKDQMGSSRIKPKILIRHKKIIEKILKPEQNRKMSDKLSGIQLELFSEGLN